MDAWKSCVEHISGFGCVCLGKGAGEGYISKIEIESFTISREVWEGATPWTAAHQASLSITIFRSLLTPMSVKLVMPYNHLILCFPLLLLPSIFPTIRIFPSEPVSSSHQVAKVLEFLLQYQSF